MAALRQLRALAALLPALLVLAVAPYFPAGSAVLYLRLLAATVVFLYPGYLAALALGRRSASATLTMSFGLFAACMGVMFLAKGSLSLALGLYLACGLVALAFVVVKDEAPEVVRGSGWVIVAGIVLGILLWQVAGALVGDRLFHLGRARKLLDLHNLSLGTVNEFADGSLHPGYAFPLWQGLLAAIARIAGIDPGAVVLHEPSVLTPLALLVAFEAGWAVFRSRGPALAAVIAQVTLVTIAPGSGGAYVYLALPATASRHLLVPIVIALFFLELDRATPSGLFLVAIGSLALALVHVTYVVYAIVPLAAFLIVRLLVTRIDFGESVRGFTAVFIPAMVMLIVFTPLAGSSTSYDPSRGQIARTLQHYGRQIAVYGHGRYALAPEMFVRSGAVAIAALVLTSLAFMAAKERWSAFVLGGALAMFGLLLIPAFFKPFSDLVSISQARRLALFYPYAFAFAGGLGILAGLLRRSVLVVALVSGITLQLLWPGDFGYKLGPGGGPGWLVWAAAVLTCVALVFFFLSPEADFGEGEGSTLVLSAGLFVLPIVVAACFHWTPAMSSDPLALSPGLTKALQTRVPERAIVLADPAVSYRIVGAVPVYVVTAPPGNVADTKRNKPYKRRRDVWKFLASGDLSYVAEYKPGWIVLTSVEAAKPELKRRLKLKPVYKDARFALYRIPRRAGR